MRRTRSQLLFAVAALLVFASCSDPTGSDSFGPLSLSVVSGDGQSGTPGSELSDPLVVLVEDARGRRVRDQIVNFRVVSGGGSTFAGVAITNNDGIAQERWTLGESGLQRLEARAIDAATGEPLTFAIFEATLVDGAPPVVSDVAASPNPVELTTSVTLSATATDAAAASTGISAMEYRIAGGAFQPMTASDGAFGSGTETAEAVFAAPDTEGSYTLCVRAQDGAGNTSAEVCIQLVVTEIAKYTIGGTVTGLAGTLVLRNNGGDDLTLSADGAFTFDTPLLAGSAYNVTVAAQPTGQTCSVLSGSGTVPDANVTTVNVTCTAPTYTVGGTLTNLQGAGCVLRLNGGNNLTLTASGPFTFPTRLADGSPYSVTVGSQPAGPNQTCVVSNATGTISGANVTNVGVNCTVNQALCTSAISLGSMAGDEGSGVRTASGTGNAWYRVQLTEENLSSVYVSATITLTVPAGIDYDLRAYCGSCGGSLAGTSLRGTGLPETINIRWEDDLFQDDVGDIYIEVRYWGGTSPNSWLLTVRANTQVSTTTCNF